MLKEFLYETAERGQEVSEETYDNNLNILPPISLRGGANCDCGFQVSEPYCHRTDKRTGRWRAMYATFVKRAGRFFFEGYNFAGETDSRMYVAEGW